MLPAQLRDLPYVIHTNRELGLMLRGIKPLAMFVLDFGDLSECVARYLRLFDRHVETGRFIRRQVPLPNLAGSDTHYLYYALPGEEWRIDAMLELRGQEGSWADKRERQLGRLLGYEDWMNDVWLSRFPSWKLNG